MTANLYFRVILMTGASLTAGALFLQAAVLPLLFKYSKGVQRKIVFSNCINYPKHLDFKHPLSCNVLGCRHFNIEFYSRVDHCDIKLGVWHIAPYSLIQDLVLECDELRVDERYMDGLKKRGSTVILYCHGNSNHRASPHRLQMYKVLQEQNYHVITFDYRGYGDSTDIRPTERGVVEDVLQVYSWLVGAFDHDQKPLVVLWGHSLGTAIAANLVSNMSDLCQQRRLPTLPPPDALVLEAFNNLADEIESHPLSKLVPWLPYYKSHFVKPFTVSSEYTFATDRYLSSVPRLPVLMMHSRRDRIVPFHLAIKLYNSIIASRASDGATLELHVFDRGHNDLCAAPAMPRVVA
ncbi:lysophosphatidylserine lipase ABHD12-like [Bicyclus anynana]|uniref:Lysophosphatidylserine lipase ABHD12-like n=1 Tax=Bicyclus anynana TaxID=110368 RepID=A0ABM3LV34_BICAN|nr:lysophosphatidylserine lipase ABHD12-like [Bicyclus anynana]